MKGNVISLLMLTSFEVGFFYYLWSDRAIPTQNLIGNGRSQTREGNRKKDQESVLYKCNYVMVYVGLGLNV